MAGDPPRGLSIREVVQRTGVAEGTLRMWERRHGFPAPKRLASGHRRYSDRDVELIKQIASERASGMSVAAAVKRANSRAETDTSSLFAALRAQRPEIESRTLTKPLLLALTRAIEDESLSRAERPLLFGSFQHERFYRESEQRWRELARTASVSAVFADFPHRRTPHNAPAELPVSRTDPLTREWAIVCDAERHGACLVAWQLPGPPPGEAQILETIWSVEPAVVREAAQICAQLAAACDYALPPAAIAQLNTPASATAEAQLQLAAAVTNRAFSYLT